MLNIIKDVKKYENFALFITVAANDSKQSHSVVGNCLLYFRKTAAFDLNTCRLYA